MYGAHKKKDSTPHSSLYLLIKIASLANYWSRTCIVLCLECTLWILTAKRQFFYEGPPFIGWLGRDRVIFRMHMCVFCTWTRKWKLEHFPYRLLLVIAFDQNKIIFPFLFYQTLVFASLSRVPADRIFEFVMRWIVSKHGNFTIDRPHYDPISSCRFLLQTSWP